jgi:hypothetical protein
MRPLLLGFNKSTQFKAVDTITTLGKTAAALPDFEACKQVFAVGKTDEEKQKNQALVDRMIYNKVRVCPSCSKPNGFTLKTCNSCGTDISKQELSKTLNVFAGFFLGIAKSTFPLTISIRHETPEILVLDDLLALSPCHVNVLPMKQFIPDWRYLLRSPVEGLAVVNKLKQSAVEVIKTQFLSNEEFMKAFTKVSAEKLLPFDAENDLSMGFNFPPSQYQLHLQCIFPVVLPYQYYLFEKGTHFTPCRFFPFEYVAEVLKIVSSSEQQKTPLPAELLKDDTPIEDIVEYFKEKHNIDAEKIRVAFCDRFDKNFLKFQNWKNEDFDVVARENEASKKLEVVSGEAKADDLMNLVNKDKLALQSYGRPYTAEGKPQGKFYSYPATSVEQIQFW